MVEVFCGSLTSPDGAAAGLQDKYKTCKMGIKVLLKADSMFTENRAKDWKISLHPTSRKRISKTRSLYFVLRYNERVREP